MKKQISKKQYNHRNKKYKNSKRYKHTKGGQPEDDGDTIVASIAKSTPDDDEETGQIPSYLEKPNSLHFIETKPSTISTNKESTITAITEFDDDITRFQPKPHNFKLTHLDSRHPLNFDVNFKTEALDKHIHDIINSFSTIRQFFPQGFNLDSFHLSVIDILNIIKSPMFIGIIKGRSKLYDIIVKDGKIEIIEISVDEFQRLSNKEGVFLLSFLNNIFHSLDRERGSINITLNNEKQIGNDNLELEELLNNYVSFIRLIISRYASSLSVKQIIYMLSLFTLDDFKSTSFLSLLTQSMTEKLHDVGTIIPKGSNFDDIITTDFYNPNKLIYKYEIDLNNILHLPDPKYGKKLLDFAKDICNIFVNIEHSYDSGGKLITEIVITKFTVTFISLILDKRLVFEGKEILKGLRVLIGITLNKEVSNLLRNTYDYSLKYIWTINTNTKNKLMRFYSINRYIPYFEEINVIHSGIKQKLNSRFSILTKGVGPYRMLTVGKYGSNKKGGNKRNNKKKLTKRKT